MSFLLTLGIPGSLVLLLDGCYNILMSPTVFKIKNYRFVFFSREEKRIHIHVSSPDGEAKFWIG